MSWEGVASEEMIKRLWKSQTVCERSAVVVVRLHKDGGHERVVYAVLETLRRALDSWMRYDDPYWFPSSSPPYYYYGPRWYCWQRTLERSGVSGAGFVIRYCFGVDVVSRCIGRNVR